MNRATITLTEDQLRLVQLALELYSRVGILQIERILDHPSIDRMILDQHTPTKKLEVGDHTLRGEVVKIEKSSITTKGSWGNGEELRTWSDLGTFRLSPDWAQVHATKDLIRRLCDEIKYHASKEKYVPNSGPGIHNLTVDESAREAFDMVQVIRHEFWKRNPNRSSITVDSHIHLSSSSPAIQVEILTKNPKDENASHLS